MEHISSETKPLSELFANYSAYMYKMQKSIDQSLNSSETIVYTHGQVNNSANAQFYDSRNYLLNVAVTESHINNQYNYNPAASESSSNSVQHPEQNYAPTDQEISHMLYSNQPRNASPPQHTNTQTHVLPVDSLEAQVAIDTSTQLMSENDSSIAISAYTKYYTDVLAYFKTLLADVEESGHNEAPEEIIKVESPQEESQVESKTEDDHDDPWSQSKTIMDGYFNRLDGERNWDWASWHNYLSWISRTHPEWFRLFTDCSKQMGINWDEMYTKWMSCQSISDNRPHIFDPNCPPPFTTEIYQQSVPIGYNDQYSDQFYYTQDQSHQVDDPKIWCDDCDQYFENDRAFSIHFRGVRHIQNALTKTMERNPNIVLDIPVTQAQTPPKVNNRSPIKAVRYNSENRFQYYRPNVAVSGPEPVTVKLSRPEIRLQHLLDICIQPLIGLNYIIEFQRIGLLECIYVCDLCEHSCFTSTIIKHVCCLRHRMSYLKNHYPPLYHILLKDSSEKRLKLKRLAFYVQRIEEYEGRKRLSIMMEKPNTTNKSIVIRKEESPFNQKKELVENDFKVDKSQQMQDKSNTKTNEQKRKSKIIKKPEDIEEGEMVDESSSSDEESTPTSCIQKKLEISIDMKENIVDNEEDGAQSKSTKKAPLFGNCSPTDSVSSFDYESSDEECSQSKNTKLPPFFRNYIPLGNAPATLTDNFRLFDSINNASSQLHEQVDASDGPKAYIPDYEAIFISDRPVVPSFTSKDGHFLSYIHHLYTTGLIELSPKTISKLEEFGMNYSSIRGEISASDEETCFENEFNWALDSIKTAQLSVNKYQFLHTYIPNDVPNEEPTTPSVAKKPATEAPSIKDIIQKAKVSQAAAAAAKTPVAVISNADPKVISPIVSTSIVKPVVTESPTIQGHRIEVICSSKIFPQNYSIDYNDVYMTNESFDVYDPNDVTSAAFQSIPVVGNSSIHCIVSDSTSTSGAFSATISNLQSIPVLTSQGRQPLVKLTSANPDEISSQPVIPLVRSQFGVLGDPPSKSSLNESKPSSNPDFSTLMSSPMEALQRLLKGDYKSAALSGSALENESRQNVLISQPDSAEIFDGYSYFTEKRKRRVAEERDQNVADQNLSSTSRPSTNYEFPKPTKLAAIADMLGMNEPPVPRVSNCSTEALPSSISTQNLANFFSWPTANRASASRLPQQFSSLLQSNATNQALLQQYVLRNAAMLGFPSENVASYPYSSTRPPVTAICDPSIPNIIGQVGNIL